jgi:hypothetical protein
MLRRSRLACEDFQRRSVGVDRLLKPRCPALSLAGEIQGHSQNHLIHRPFGRELIAGEFLERRAIGLDRFLEMRRAALLLANE